MKKLYYAYLSLGLLAIYIFMTSSSLGRATDDNVGNTGAPGESTLCSNCHNNGAYGNVTVSIQIFELGTTNPVSFYVPNTLYDGRITVSGSMGSPLGYGFQLTTMRNGNSPYAAYSNWASNVKLKAITSGAQAGRTYLEHNGVMNNNQFNFQWTAPTSGNISFFASGVACNANGGTSGDRSSNSSLSLSMAPTLSVTSQVTPVSCFNGSDGSIQLTVNSGVEPYTYQWSDGSNASSFNNLPAGNYSVTVTDGLGQTYEENFTLDNPTQLNLSVTVTQPVVVGESGSIELFINGGSSPYAWSINGGPDQVYPEFVAGIYVIEVMDLMGCTASASFEIVEAEGIEVIATVNHVTCSGLTDGQIELSISGGVEPYDVVWENSPGITPDGYAAGNYSATVTDAVGNETVIEVTVTEPEPVLISPSFDPILCNGESSIVTIDATGGTLPFSGTGEFSVSAGEQEFTVVDAQGCIYSTWITLDEPSPFIGNSMFAEISCTDGDLVLDITADGGSEPYTGTGEVHFENPGTYAIPLTDANGCDAVANVTITAIDGPTLVTTFFNPTCWSSCNGFMALDAGDAEGEFVWDDGFMGPQRENVCAGEYVCTFNSTDGCSFVNTFTLTAPDSIQIFINSPDGVCSGETAQITGSATGGTLPYNMTWSNGQAGTTTSLGAGTHQLNVSDGNGCAAEMEFFIEGYPGVSITQDSIIEPSCTGMANGYIAISAVSASDIAQYSWVPNVSSDYYGTGLLAGDYAITVTDNDGCSATLTIELDEPTEVEGNITIDDGLMGVGTITAAPSGGTPPYIFDWSNGSTDDEITVNTGYYSVTITDANGCEVAYSELYISSSIDELHPLALQAFPNPFENKLTVEAKGSYRIANALGETLNQGSGYNVVDTSTWPSGMYFIINQNNQTIRLIKQ
jgi:hypothetical protein